MADMKTGIFAKNVQKRLNRAQEKVRCGTGGWVGRGGLAPGGQQEEGDGGGAARGPRREAAPLARRCGFSSPCPRGRGAAAGGSLEGGGGGTHDTRYYVTDPFNRGSRPPPGPTAAPRHPPAGRSPLRGGGGAGGAGVHLPQARASRRFLALQAEQGSPRG